MANRPERQAALYGDFAPARAGTPLFCHEEFLESMEANRANTVGRRAALLLQRLLVDAGRQYYKPTQGENRGWRRSPLGGNHGSHFYAWWAPRGAAPLQSNPEFQAAPEGSVFLRAIRHHDDHHPLPPQSLDENYLPLAARELRQADLVPPPWTTGQKRFADARQRVRIIKGFPGSGKTTALWHAADQAGRESILYITYSPELAARARDHFDKFAPGHKRFQVLTYAQMLRQLLASDAPFQPVREARRRFVRAVSAFSGSTLGPWTHQRAGLFDEMHAHLFGAALPSAAGRFPAVPNRRVPARQYREWRERSIGRGAAESVVEIAETLRRRDPEPLEERFFLELDLAWRAAQKIRESGAGALQGFDCVALDEAQDLTPLEAMVVVELTAAMGSDTRLLVAGDEAQTVRPTDFEWGWFQDLLHHRLASPVEFNLQVNLRSPRRIAALVNRCWNLYGAIAKHERPGGSGTAEIDENAGDQVIFCAAKPGPELDDLLEAFAGREGFAVIALGEEIPAYVPERLRGSVLTTFEAKGLDFQAVCLLDPGHWLERVMRERDHGRALELDDLGRRLAIDQLRVALSRPAEKLYWVDVNPTSFAIASAHSMLSFDGPVWPVVPAVLRASLDEEALDVEERVQLCQADARQFLAVRPAMAWSRARQAVALLGEPKSDFSVTDPEARRAALLTLCEVAATLALRHVLLPVELGIVNLLEVAAHSALESQRVGLTLILSRLRSHEQSHSGDELPTLLDLGEVISKWKEEVAPWLLVELQPRAAGWLGTLEEELQRSPLRVYRMLPALYDLFAPAEAGTRSAEAREKAIRALMKAQSFDPAIELLRETFAPDPRLLAECHEGLGELEAAAAEYLQAGRPQDALRCFRSIPDFDRSLELLKDLPEHPARESLLWLQQMRDLVSQRPAPFGKVVLPAEKKLLEVLLETSLGVSRKRAAPKPGAKKPGRPRKNAKT